MPAHRGAAHHGAKLTEDAVRDARRMRAGGATVKALAAAYGVGWTAMRNALEGRTWKDVDARRSPPAS